MCGIDGYVGWREAGPLLVDGLKKLEYRGYDSAGVCLINKGVLKNLKKVGKVSELEDFLLGLGSSRIGIAHTRWATHGEPSELNAHPHLDCKGEIAIVHNGIIENFQSLKRILINKGHNFVSETDSEVISHLIEEYYLGNLEDAVIKVVNIIEGAFGILVIQKDKKKIIAAKKGSPLVIGVGKGEMFVASDVLALLNHTRHVIYLDDNEIALLSEEGYAVRNFKGINVEKEIHEIKWDVENIEKGNYNHFMLKEIFEQVETIKNALRGRLKNNEIKLSLDLDVGSLKKIMIVACGTSWHSALIGKYLIESISGIPVEVDYASEFRYRNPLISFGDLIIAISQSGETADTLSAIREAKSKGAKTLGIVNVVGSSIAREVDTGIYLHAGPEIGVASTKAFTSQVVSLILFSLFLAKKKGRQLDEELINDLVNLPDKVGEVLDQSKIIEEISLKLANYNNFLYLGRGINFPVALEGALKLKEISYIHAEGYPAAEMKHGPIALLDSKVPVVFLATRDKLFDKLISNMQEVKARGSRIIAITNKDVEEVKDLADFVIEVPRVRSEVSAVLNIIPLQLLSYYIAVSKGIDVDKPRNLAKSVTVE